MCKISTRWDHIGKARVIEGDIAVIDAEPGSTQNAFRSERDKLWDRGEVPFVLDFEFSQDDEKMIRDAMQHVTDQVPCIKFR